MIISTLGEVPDRKIKSHLGLVNGNTVRAKHLGRDIFAGLKQLIGGEIRGYTEMMEESRDEAVRRMMSKAEKMGANAVIAVRFSTSQIMHGAAEVMVYGTAVVIE